MTATTAFFDGMRRVNRAPMVVVGTFALTLFVALPLSYALREMISAHLGPSLAAESAASGTNYDWWQEFSAQASGLGATFIFSIVGFGAVLENVSGLLDNAPLTTTIAGATAAWLILWSFLAGGVLDRFARGRKTRAHGFFAACGMHFPRLLRLGALAWLAYAFLFWYVHAWIFGTLLEWLTRDVTVERTAFAFRVIGYALFGTLLVLCNIVFDYARVRIVVEDRRSAIGALVGAGRFLRRHAAGASGLYALNSLAFMVLVAIYGAVSPGAPGSGLAMWGVLALGEAYILARHYLKLVFYASETAFFQGALAHAAYTAAPSVQWPDSPAAETISNADRAAVS